MNDSDNELSNNIFSYPNVNTTVYAKGPNLNISNLNIRKQLTSTMYNMPRNFERQRYAQSVCDQASMYYRRGTSPMSTRSAYRRETSPMSTRSVCDMRPFNFQPYHSGMNSMQSMYHGRSGSPMSLRSIDSTASVSAKDIALAFKNTQFNTHDIQIIKHAYRNLMKNHTRKRFARKRKLGIFLKRSRNSGDDSGEPGSDSSVSDDGRSAKTTTLKASNNTTNRQFNISNIRTVKDNIFRDNTEDVQPNTFKNMFSLDSSSMSKSIRSNNSAPKQYNIQKDRFKSSFLLPSQRFNRSVASTMIPENFERQHTECKNNTRVKNNCCQRPNNNQSKTDSEDEEIFSETVKENTVLRTESQNKRSLSGDELNLPYNKRKRISSPIKNTAQKIPPSANNKIVNTFDFVKPTLPVKKIKPKIPEKLIPKSSHPQQKLIAKSAQTLTDITDSGSSKPTNTEPCKQPQVHENTKPSQLEQHETMDNTDVSMRPSFIKRKLFTQNLDVIEKSNVSSDGVNSPHSNVYGGMPKEKNKARKLVTAQSCLNREVQDDNNLLDLIHKIVPLDQMNATSQSSVNPTRLNATKPVSNNNNDDDDKWDVTSVILTCNEDDCSETYTDEEILKSDDKTIDNNPVAFKETPIVPCRVVLADVYKKQQINNDIKNKFKPNDVTTKKLQNFANLFLDSDTESDVDWQESLYRSNVKEYQQRGKVTIQRIMKEAKNPTKKRLSTNSSAFPDVTKSLDNTAVNTTMKSTIDSGQKLKVGNVSFRSHRLSKKKTCGNETCINDTKPAAEPRNNYKDTSKPVENIQKHHSVAKSSTKSDSQIKTTKNNIKTKSSEENDLAKNRFASNTQKKINNETKPEDSKKMKNTQSKPKSISRSKVEKIVKPVQNKSLKTKVTKTTEKKLNNDDVRNTKTNLRKPANTSSVLDSTVDTVRNTSTVSQRPLRSCRATSQNRSLEVSTLQMSNDSCFSKSLRSRTILYLSSSIDNITLHIKPKTKAISKTVAQVNSRISDVSFSLGNKNTTTPKKVTRNKGKRKT